MVNEKKSICCGVCMIKGESAKGGREECAGEV